MALMAMGALMALGALSGSSSFHRFQIPLAAHDVPRGVNLWNFDLRTHRSRRCCRESCGDLGVFLSGGELASDHAGLDGVQDIDADAD